MSGPQRPEGPLHPADAGHPAPRVAPHLSPGPGDALRLHAADGTILAAHRFDPPAGRAPRAAVLIGAAMGVPQRYYAAFARFLAAEGFAVLTFDYRGIGESRPRSLRGFRATMDDWARLDYDAALRAARSLVPPDQGPLLTVGHSLGGQMPGLAPSRGLLDGLLGIATGTGYWRIARPATRRRAPLMWWVMVPLVVPLAGYFPGARLGAIGDLPAGVARQWTRWCRDPQYCIGVEGREVRESYASVRFPVHCVSFEDDEMLTAANTEALLGFYANAPREHLRIDPRGTAAGRVGHLGFFRERLRDTLWRDAVGWLDALAEHAAAGQNAAGRAA